MNEIITPGTGWDCHGHYETADGDRVALMDRDGRWAVLWSYKAPHGPQLIDHDSDGDNALRLFRKARRVAMSRASLVYDQPDCFACQGKNPCRVCQDRPATTADGGA
jgi:hypothetical protein